MNKIDFIVKEMIEKHVGGETFFDNLDDEIRKNINIIDELIDMIPDFKNKNIIVSGSFGRVFFDYIKLISLYPNRIVWVNGGLRKGKSIQIDFSNHKNREFIFIDDSFYSGKTRDIIDCELYKYSSYISSTYVAYDGSKNKDDTVNSLYRYYE